MQRIRESFDRQGFMRTLGAVLESAGWSPSARSFRRGERWPCARGRCSMRRARACWRGWPRQWWRRAIHHQETIGIGERCVY